MSIYATWLVFEEGAFEEHARLEETIERKQASMRAHHFDIAARIYFRTPTTSDSDIFR